MRLCSFFPYSFIEPRVITKTKHSLTSFLGIYANGPMALYQTLRLFIMCIAIGAGVLLYEAVPLKGPYCLLLHGLICLKAFWESVSFSVALGSCGLVLYY